MTVNAPAGVSTSPTVKAKAPVEPSSAIVWLSILLIVGRSFAATAIPNSMPRTTCPGRMTTVWLPAVVSLVGKT